MEKNVHLIQDWQKIKRHFSLSFRSNFHVSLATVDQDNHPVVTPIGSLFLNDNQTGFYFEKYPVSIPEAIRHSPAVCILAVRSQRWFWLKALFNGSFSEYPGIRLYGELGVKRPATPEETSRLRHRMRVTRGLRGNTYLWGNMPFVREIRFTRAEKINLGNMTSRL